jgi:uncharacterized ion transporter superfamily protein YfcC
MPFPTFKPVKVPHVFVVLSLIVLFSGLSTYLIPSGVYQRHEVQFEGTTRNIIVPGTYRPIPKHFSLKGLLIGDHTEDKAHPTSILGFISAIPKGLNQSFMYLSSVVSSVLLKEPELWTPLFIPYLIFLKTAGLFWFQVFLLDLP